MTELKTTIGLEIHVQLKTKSKMFCRCDNQAEGKSPNSVVCPVCLGMPGALPVANKQAIEWTIKTGLALGCDIPRVAKFDRKHYFYPDLPKGYQISQYDEPFCVGGSIKIEDHEIRLNRIHLEEDAGKLIHSGKESLVDLNRAGTPLMEIVTEPDITSPFEAGEFLRHLQKVVRDVVKVSEASMEKGHMRCDANISLHDGTKMSPIIELKNINSFKFVEKALALVETHLNSTHDSWPDKLTKETWGYDSVLNKVYLQRSKEGATDYRYFPCPDLPPFDSSVFDLEALKSDLGQTADDKKSQYELTGLSAQEAHILATNQTKEGLYLEIAKHFENKEAIAKFVVHSTLDFDENDLNNASAYANLIEKLNGEEISKKMAADISAKIHETGLDFNQAFALVSSTSNVGETELKNIIAKVVETNEKELLRFQSGEKQLFGFFMGQVLKETKGKGDPQTISKILREML